MLAELKLQLPKQINPQARHPMDHHNGLNPKLVSKVMFVFISFENTLQI